MTRLRVSFEWSRPRRCPVPATRQREPTIDAGLHRAGDPCGARRERRSRAGNARERSAFSPWEGAKRGWWRTTKRLPESSAGTGSSARSPIYATCPPRKSFPLPRALAGGGALSDHQARPASRAHLALDPGPDPRTHTSPSSSWPSLACAFSPTVSPSRSAACTPKPSASPSPGGSSRSSAASKVEIATSFLPGRRRTPNGSKPPWVCLCRPRRTSWLENPQERLPDRRHYQYRCPGDVLTREMTMS